MNVLAINGSPHTDGNTAHMLRSVLAVCEEAGMETTVFQAGGRPVRGCTACGGCEKHPGRCAIDDWVNELYPLMLGADAILLGSPTYFSDVSPEMKAVIDRCGFIASRSGKPLGRKVGAAVCAVRRAGSLTTLGTMQNFLLMNDMILPGSTYWNMSLCLRPGDYEKDDEGLRTMRRLGENMVWLLQKLHA